MKTLKHIQFEALQIFQSAEEIDEYITSKLAIYAVNTAKEHVTHAMECIAKVFNKTEPDSSQERAPSGPQKSINVVTKRLSIYLDNAINVLRSIRQGANTKDSDLDRREEENIVNQSLLF